MSSSSDGARSALRLPFPQDPRAFDFSFAFDNPAFSDRRLLLEITDEAEGSPIPAPSSSPDSDVYIDCRRDDSVSRPLNPLSSVSRSFCHSNPRSFSCTSVSTSFITRPSSANASISLTSLDKEEGEEGASKVGPEEEEHFRSDGRNIDHVSDSHSPGVRTFQEEAAVEGRVKRRLLHVISAILVSQSDFFKSLFSPEWSVIVEDATSVASISKETPIVLKLSTEEERPFIGLMHYMYTGRLSSEDPEDVLHMLFIANKYAVLSCVNVCAHHLREVPLSLEICCILLRVCSGVVLSEAAAFLVASSAAFLVNRFGNLDATWRSPEFLDLPLEALEAILGSDDVCVASEETVFSAMLHWVRHNFPSTETPDVLKPHESPECPQSSENTGNRIEGTGKEGSSEGAHDGGLPARREIVARLAEKIRFPAMETEALSDLVMVAPEAESEVVRGLVMEALWFKCSSFERQQELVQSAIKQHRRYVRRRQLSIYSEVLLQDCYMLQPGQAILLAGGAWVCGKLFSLKVMRVAAPVGGSDFGLFLQASQRCPTQDKVLDDSVSVEFSFKVKEWPVGNYVQQKQSASHTFKGLFRERGYRSLLNPWNEVMKDNNKYFRNGVMYIRADLRVIQPGESLASFE